MTAQPSMTRSTGAQVRYRDLLLALVSYPDRTPNTALSNAARLAACLGGEVTALALGVKIDAPRNRLADLLMNFKDLVAEEESRSAANARIAAKAFQSTAHGYGAPAEFRIETVELYGEAERFAERARTHDLTLLPFGPGTLNDRGIAEALLFQSGRPVLLLPDSRPVANDCRLRAVTIAWDGGRAAARALADAMPALAAAEQVRVLTVLNEKPAAQAGVGDEVLRHLQLHGVKAEIDEVDADGEPIGEVLKAHVDAQSVDLLVMGAYGRSRAREVVLGGATRSVLDELTVPVLMSH